MFHYAAVHLEAIADNARDVDFAMRWGFGLSVGRSSFGRTPAGSRSQVGQGRHRGRQGAEQRAAAGLGVRRPQRRAHARGLLVPGPQDLPAGFVAAGLSASGLSRDGTGLGAVAPLASGTELFRNDEVRVWTLDGEVVIASITAKLHLISPTVTDRLLKALEIAEGGYQVW